MDPVAEHDIALTHAATATPQTAGQMARAVMRWSLRRPRFRVFAVLVLVLVGGTMYWAYAGDGLSPVARVVGSLFWAAVAVLAVVSILSGLAWFTNLRSFRKTVPAGSVQKTGFGEEGFATSNALSSSRFSYQAVRSIDRQGAFVIVCFVGSPVARVYPEALFPGDVVERIRSRASASEP